MWMNFMPGFLIPIPNEVLDDFLVQGTDSGTVSLDLSGIDPSIDVLGLEFQLNSDDMVYDSTVDISDVHMESADSIPTVSEWGMIVLTILLITAGTFVIRRREQ